MESNWRCKELAAVNGFVVTLAWAFLLLLPALSPAQPGEVQYVYDEAGRLVAVIDPTGEAAEYVYDAVGNLTAITRHSSSTAVKILYFSPQQGPVGATVIVSGTGFSTVPSQNTVSFNGTNASVTSATTTQIVTNVPAGATSGAITVTSPSGSAASADPFTVTADSQAPTISGFSPAIGAAGTALTVNGSNFSPVAMNNSVVLNKMSVAVASSTSATIASSVPAVATSGRIHVATVDGSAVSASDFFVAPPPYAATDVAFSDRLVLGQSKTASIATAGKIGLLVFDGDAGQRVSAALNASTMSSCTLPSNAFRILTPFGKTLVESANLCTASTIVSAKLPTSGTYTLLIDPSGAATGQVTATVYDLVDVTGPTTLGQTMSATLNTPGQRALWTFAGAANQRVSAVVNTSSVGSCSLGAFRILKPDATTLVTWNSVCAGVILGPSILPTSGAYTITAASRRPLTRAAVMLSRCSSAVELLRRHPFPTFNGALRSLSTLHPS